jgi:hypothetical protein
MVKIIVGFHLVIDGSGWKRVEKRLFHNNNYNNTSSLHNNNMLQSNGSQESVPLAQCC